MILFGIRLICCIFFCLYFQRSRYSSVNSFVRRRFLLFDTSCSFSFVQTYLANNFKHIYAYTFTWITWWSFQISFVLYYILCIKITKRKFDATKYFIHCIPLSHILILLILKWDKRKCLSEQRTIAFFKEYTDFHRTSFFFATPVWTFSFHLLCIRKYFWIPFRLNDAEWFSLWYRLNKKRWTLNKKKKWKKEKRKNIVHWEKMNDNHI